MAKKIKKMDNTVVRELAKELTEVMGKTLKKYGLEVASKGGKFGTTDIDLKFNIFVPNADGLNVAKESKYETEAKSLGLTCDYGFTFKDKRTTLKVVGVSLSRFKFPVDLLNVNNGKTMKSTVNYVNSMMDKVA